MCKVKSSHQLVNHAVTAVKRMAHRGAIGADGKTGDGCGILMKLPEAFFRAIAAEQGWQLGKKFAVGQIFLSRDSKLRDHAKQVMAQELQREMLTVHGWREVPVNLSVVGEIAERTRPEIEQVFVSAQPGWRKKDLERRLYMAKRRSEQRLVQDHDFYIASLSLFTDHILKAYPSQRTLIPFLPKSLTGSSVTNIDLCCFQSTLSHQHAATLAAVPNLSFFSAQMREINTIAGNRAWAAAKEVMKFTHRCEFAPNSVPANCDMRFSHAGPAGLR